MARHKSQRGAGKLTTLVFGTLIFVTLFCAYNIMPFYYYFYELQNQFESHARVAQTFTDKEIRQKLLLLIRQMEIPAKPEDLKISRDNGMIRISMRYSEYFYVTFQGKDYDIHRFDFFAKAEAPIEPPKRT